MVELDLFRCTLVRWKLHCRSGPRCHGNIERLANSRFLFNESSRDMKTPRFYKCTLTFHMSCCVCEGVFRSYASYRSSKSLMQENFICDTCGCPNFPPSRGREGELRCGVRDITNNETPAHCSYVKNNFSNWKHESYIGYCCHVTRDVFSLSLVTLLGHNI